LSADAGTRAAFGRALLQTARRRPRARAHPTGRRGPFARSRDFVRVLAHHAPVSLERRDRTRHASEPRALARPALATHALLRSVFRGLLPVVHLVLRDSPGAAFSRRAGPARRDRRSLALRPRQGSRTLASARGVPPARRR